jgi:NitT/TauT family transport system ATP-binding protein
MTDSCLLKAVDVSFTYDTSAVLNHLSLGIGSSEIVALLGPSGCGKTTLLNLIAGFLRPTSGRLEFDGAPITRPGPERAVVFQSGALFEWLTARENIEFSLSCRGVSKPERRKLSARMISLVGLDGFGESYPYQMSGGMRQRVGVARVIAAEPRIMLMDEPFAAVDVQTRETLQEELRRIHHAARCAIVFVTHSIDEAVFLADRIVLMARQGGQIEREFTVDLPSPRWDALNRLDPAFLRLRDQIYRAMKDLGPTATALGRSHEPA